MFTTARHVRMAAAAALGVAALATGSPAQARVPAWPTVAAALPAGFQVPATTTTELLLPRMQERLLRRVAKPPLGTDVSVHVTDLATGKRVFAHRSRNPQAPASTMKTATALAALSALGADHHMPTAVEASTDGRRLTLVGGGDPLLSGDDLRDLAALTADAATATATGTTTPRLRLQFDDSLFAWPELPAGWYSSYVPTYAARPTALTRDLARVADGGLEAARYFRNALREEGLRVRKKVSRVADLPGYSTVARLRGHTIAEAVWPMLQYSDNSIAENLIRHVALARGFETTTTGSAAAVRAELARLGVPLGRSRFVDGSGLSDQNRLSAKTLSGIIRAMADPRRPDLSVGIRTTALPTAGMSGTLISRFNRQGTRCAIGRVMAKTGTLTGALALAGIAASADGRIRSFAIVVNDPPSGYSTDTVRHAIDRIATTITGCR